MEKQQLLEALDELTERECHDEVAARATIAEGLTRTLRALDTMSVWLVQAQTGFGAHDYAGIQRILDGKVNPKVKDGG